MKGLRVDVSQSGRVSEWNGNHYRDSYSFYDLKTGCFVEPRIGRTPEISRQSSMLAVTGCDSHPLNQPL